MMNGNGPTMAAMTFDDSYPSNGHTSDTISLQQSKEVDKLKLAKAKRRQKVSHFQLNSPFRFIVEQRTKEKEQAGFAAIANR